MNAIALITKYSTKAWDKVYKAESRSSLLDGENDLVKFTGVKTVKVFKGAVSGLSDYKRPNGPHEGVFGGDGHDTSFAAGQGYGYQQGDVQGTWEEFTINCDRAVQLRIELFDDEETDGLAVGFATTEVSRTQVVPEVDAYCFSKIAENAGHIATNTITLSNTLGYNANGPIQALNDAFLALAEAEVPEEDQIIFCSNDFFNKLRSTNELVRRLDQAEYSKDIKFTISEYEGRKIVPVPANRFKTSIKLLQGGYGWNIGSKNIDFIVCAKSSIIHVVKYDKVRVFNPGVVQDFDGYKVNVRIYHDLFVLDNKKPSIYVHVSGDATAAVTSERSLTYAYDAVADMIKDVVIKPNGDLARALYASTGDLAIGSKVSADVGTHALIAPGLATGLAAGTYHLYGIDNGEVTVKAVETFTIA